MATKKKGTQRKRGNGTSRKPASKRSPIAKPKQSREAKLRSAAAKKGWQTRKRREREIEERGAPIVQIEGPHGRPALTKDFDGLNDVKELAKLAKKFYPDARNAMFAFRMRIVSDAKTGETEDRWVSIPFAVDGGKGVIDRQANEAGEYLRILMEGRTTYGLPAIPIEITVVINE